MKEQIVVKAEPRAVQGSAAAGRLRREGRLPAVLYSAGKQGEPLQIDAHDFDRLLHRHHGEHMLADLVVGGAEPRKVILKETQLHPLTHRLQHVDFQEISMTERLTVEVPIALVGEAAGVLVGGLLDHLLREIEIECLPDDLMEQIELDVSALGIGDRLTVADIPLDPARYTVLTDADLAVAAVSAPRVEEEETPAEGAAAEAGEGGEPEVIKEKKDEEEDGAAKD